MYTSIVVPLDGSPFGNRALPVALVLASRSDALLHLVHVREPNGLQGIGPVDARIYEGRERKVRAELSAIATRLSGESSVRVEIRFLDGPVVPALQQYLSDGRHDLVVMMTHGRGGLSTSWLGSVADELTRQSPVPLLLLRQEPPWLSDASEPLFHRVLVPLDGSSMADTVLDGVLSLATTDLTVLVLLTVIARVRLEAPDSDTDAITGPSHEVAGEREAALSYLHGVAEELRAGGAVVEVHVESRQSVARGILDAANEQKVDLIALSTHGRGSLSRFIHGSIADKIVRGAAVPILVCCPADARANPLVSRLESAAIA